MMNMNGQNKYIGKIDDECSCSTCDCSNDEYEPIVALPPQTAHDGDGYRSVRCSNGQRRLARNDNHPSEQSHLSPVGIESVSDTIDQSYAKMANIYSSIKQTKLDSDFILSVNDYLDRLKANVYKDLIRRETLLRNGKNHAENLLSLLRCVCKISYEQSLELSGDAQAGAHAALYTMTAIDYILHRHFPSRKPLLNHILTEFISMWLHESLRGVQEDFSVLVEHGSKQHYFPLCLCLFHKLESLCAVNWERLQMLQSFRLTHFDQLMKPNSTKLETSEQFLTFYGKPWKLATTRPELPVTVLYANRTDSELANISDIHQRFRRSVAKILTSEQRTQAQRISTPFLDVPSTAIATDAPEEENVVSSLMNIPDEPLQTITSQANMFPLDDVSSKSHDTAPRESDSMQGNAPLHGSTQSLMKSAELFNDVSIASMNPRSIEDDNDQVILEGEPSSYSNLSEQQRAANSTVQLNVELNELIRFLKDLASDRQDGDPPSLASQLSSALQQNHVDPHAVLRQISSPHPSDPNDASFLAAFTRALRQELADAQIVRGALTGDALPQIGLTAAGDNVDRERVLIEITHDPSRCAPTAELLPCQLPFCNHCCGRDVRTDYPKAARTVNVNRCSQRPSPSDCIVTSDSLFYARKSDDQHTHSLTVEQNDAFR